MQRLPHEMVLEQFAEEDDDDDDGDEEGSSSGRGHGLIQHNDQHGMNVAQQRAVVDAFKEHGKTLLNSTILLGVWATQAGGRTLLTTDIITNDGIAFPLL
eukprot:1161727-Pelagomonas_calceolata.AAC.5